MLINDINNILLDKKATDIQIIDTTNCKTRMTDTCIIASGTSSRHMQAVADYIYKELKARKLHPHIEGDAKSGWVLIEASNIEIHLFKPDLRSYYNIEELLNSGKRPE